MQTELKTEPKYVAFATQKGGAGKTTLTVLVASYLHYVKGRNVAVIDCDYPQHSIRLMRERDWKMTEQDAYFRDRLFEQVMRLGDKKSYPVVGSSPVEALGDAEQIISQGDYDFIFFDLPGTINSRGVIDTLLNVDHIVSPISADKVVLESTLEYLTVLRQEILKAGKNTHVKSIHLVWNLVDAREKSELYAMYEGFIAELGFPILKTNIPDSKRFRREQSESHKALFRSTLFPPDKSLIRGSHLDALADELLEIFK